MKRDRFAKDYEKVRERAGLARAKFIDPDAPPPSHEAQRFRDLVDDFSDRLDARSQAEIERDAKRKADADELSARANESIRLGEFAAVGVAPPEGMKVSLGLLLQLGWTIGHFDGEKMLLRPGTKPPRREPSPPSDDIPF